MAKLSNVTNALKDTKTRTIFIVVIVIILIGIAIGWIGLRRSQEQAVPAGVSVVGAPAIESIPGVGTPSREYVKTQEAENILRAQQSAREGTSSVPTITRTTYVGPSEFTQPGVPGAVTSTTADCSPEALARARQAGVKAEELRCKGCDAAALRAAGYTAGELMNAGFNAQQLKEAGFSAAELREAGFSAAELANAGFSPSELAAAGYSVAELTQAGISADQLAAAGITAQQLAAAGIGASSKQLPKDCSVANLTQARSQGVSAAELRKMGCGVAALRAAGYSAKELKDAGFNAKELKDAGFSANDLKNAGFSAGELRQAGFSANDLKNAGFSAGDLRDAGFSADALANAGFTTDELKAAGYTDGELARAGVVSPATIATGATINGGTETQTASGGMAGVPAVIPSTDPSLAALEQLQKRQAEQLSLQERQDRMIQLQQSMGQQASDLLASWSPPTTQSYVMGAQADAQNGGAGVNGAGAAQSGGVVEISPPIIKAGHIMFAVLDTALDSDEPGPILATIVEGPYKGAKLVGSFQRVNKKVLVSFNLINLPALAASIPISAVAIDANTARTALADSVDSHYLLRYGTLFGSAFISGLADATLDSGSTTNVTLFGVTTATPVLDTAQKLTIAGGEVGKQFANVMRGVFYTPPTVKVNAGAGIGILFMQDVSINAPSITTTAAPPPTSVPSQTQTVTTATTTTAPTTTTTSVPTAQALTPAQVAGSANAIYPVGVAAATAQAIQQNAAAAQALLPRGTTTTVQQQ